MTTMIEASPTKLRSGEWGAKVKGTVTPGDAIHITTKAGKSWTATVGKVVWSGEGVAIVTTRSTDRPGNGRRRTRGTWTGCYCGSVEEFAKSSDCASCAHDRY